MKKRHIQTMVYLLLFVFVLFSVSKASTFMENKEQPFSFQNNLAQDDFERSRKLFNLTHTSYFAYESDSVKANQSADVYGFKGKSLKRAFLYSMIVPGAGEFYAGSKIKAGLFFGLDVTLWALYFNYHGKGKDEEKQYRAFADTTWDVEGYKSWLLDSLYTTNPDVNSQNVSDTFWYWDKEKQERTYLSHHLPDRKTQQYYEMIGKYEQFRWGWEDYSDATKNSERRGVYLDMRRLSNDWLNKAKNSAMISLANHLLSAFDAAFAVKRYNKKGERFSQVEFKMRLTERDNEVVPRLSVSMRF